MNCSAVCVGLFIFQCCILIPWEDHLDTFVYFSGLDNSDFMKSKMLLILQIKIVIFKFPNEQISFFRILFCSKQLTDSPADINGTD